MTKRQAQRLLDRKADGNHDSCARWGKKARLSENTVRKALDMAHLKALHGKEPHQRMNPATIAKLLMA